MTTDEMAITLYDAEINFAVTCFWDGGYESRLGDHLNGWGKTHHSDTFPEAIKVVFDQAYEQWPQFRSTVKKGQATETSWQNDLT